MTKPSNPFDEELPDIDPAVFERIDAKLEAARNDPNFSPPHVDWIDDPDPFGTNWDWLYPDNAGHSVEPKPSSVAPETVPTLKMFTIPRRRLLTAIAWAASILLVFTFDRLILRPGGDAELDATGAKVTPGGALGGQAWTVHVPSKRRAFVTLAVIGANNIPKFYPGSGTLIEARPDKSLDYAFEGQVGDSVLVVMTETPASDVLNDAVVAAVNGGRRNWNDADSFRRFLEETLRSLGYNRFSIRVIPLTR